MLKKKKKNIIKCMIKVRSFELLRLLTYVVECIQSQRAQYVVSLMYFQISCGHGSVPASVCPQHRLCSALKVKEG